MLSNGLPVWIVEHHGVPVVRVNPRRAKSGTGDDPAGKFGIASLTASLLTEGAGARSALQRSPTRSISSALISTNAGSDSPAAPPERAGRAARRRAPIMADVALRPTFPQATELIARSSERLTNIIQARDDPASIDQRLRARALRHISPVRHRAPPAPRSRFRASPSKTSVPSIGRRTSRRTPIIAVGDVTPARRC
jgi:zinc protease